MNIQLTEWYESNSVPMHLGVYEVDDGDGMFPWHAYWNGKKFGYRTWQGPQHAYDMKDEETCCPEHTFWRGLSENPNT